MKLPALMAAPPPMPVRKTSQSKTIAKKAPPAGSELLVNFSGSSGNAGIPKSFEVLEQQIKAN